MQVDRGYLNPGPDSPRKERFRPPGLALSPARQIRPAMTYSASDTRFWRDSVLQDGGPGHERRPENPDRPSRGGDRRLRSPGCMPGRRTRRGGRPSGDPRPAAGRRGGKGGGGSDGRGGGPRAGGPWGGGETG